MEAITFLSIFRVVWVFGGPVYGPIEDITPTCLTQTVLATLREADSHANAILREHGTNHLITV